MKSIVLSRSVLLLGTFVLDGCVHAPSACAFQPQPMLVRSAASTRLQSSFDQWQSTFFPRCPTTAATRNQAKLQKRLHPRSDFDLFRAHKTPNHSTLWSSSVAASSLKNAIQREVQPHRRSVAAMWSFVWNRIKERKTNVRIGARSIRRAIATLCLVAALTFGSAGAAWAVSGGRMGGGSFKSSPSRSSSSMRSSGSGRTSTLSRPPSSSRIQMLPPPSSSRPYYSGRSHSTSPIIINSFGNRWYAPSRESAIVNTRTTAGEIAVLTGAGAVLVYSAYNNYKNRDDEGDYDATAGLLGTGYTVGSLTVAIDVPNRNDPENILAKLSRLSQHADTVSRKGVQTLLSDVALEVLRHERSVTSAFAQSKAYRISGQAEREFQVLSVHSQSKVDRLTVNKFGSQDKSSSSISAPESGDGAPTVAIVTINYAIEGDATKLPAMRTRQDLRQALSRIASDALVGECLLTAEVLWAPELASETLSREKTYSDFPNLVPI